MKRARATGLALALALALVLSSVTGADGSDMRAVAWLPMVVRQEPTRALQWATVTHIVDGDTFDALLDCCACLGPWRVRPLGIDAPERGRCYFTEATDALGDMIMGQRVGLEVDTSQADSWGRLLRWVWADGVLVNVAIVRDGFAVVDIRAPDARYAAQLQAAQAEAQAAQHGGWRTCGW